MAVISIREQININSHQWPYFMFKEAKNIDFVLSMVDHTSAHLPFRFVHQTEINLSESIGKDFILLFFSQINGHNLTMIASDGYPMEPFVVDGLVTSPGERFDIVINAINDPNISMFSLFSLLHMPREADEITLVYTILAPF